MVETSRLDGVDVDRFVEDGFVVVRGAVPLDTVVQCRAALWHEIDADPDDPATWTRPVVRIDWMSDPPFVAAANTPVLTETYDRLVGRDRWIPPRGLGTFPVRFPHVDDPGDTGWHIDGGFYVPGENWPYVNLVSRGRGLLMLFLLSDVGPDDAPTRIKVGSHLDVPRYLAGHGERGRSVLDLCEEMDADGTLDAPHRTAAAWRQRGGPATSTSAIPSSSTLHRRSGGRDRGSSRSRRSSSSDPCSRPWTGHSLRWRRWSNERWARSIRVDRGRPPTARLRGSAATAPPAGPPR
ncbi:hypothetical protein ACLBYD_07450 [Rhodococcus sp. C26F]